MQGEGRQGESSGSHKALQPLVMLPGSRYWKSCDTAPQTLTVCMCIYIYIHRALLMNTEWYYQCLEASWSYSLIFEKLELIQKRPLTIVIWVLENASYHKTIYVTPCSACVIYPTKEQGAASIVNTHTGKRFLTLLFKWAVTDIGRQNEGKFQAGQLRIQIRHSGGLGLFCWGFLIIMTIWSY